MENTSAEIKGIYNNGTVRVEKWPFPQTIQEAYNAGNDTVKIKELSDKIYTHRVLTFANIAEADKPYWEIECDIEAERKRLLDLQADKTRWVTQDEFVRLEKLSAIMFDEPTEVTIDRIENNKAVIV